VSWAGELKVPDMVGKGLSVFGAWHWNHVTHAADMMSLIRRSGPKLQQFITHTFPLSRVEEAWKLQLSGQCGKIVMHPWD
jgi:threonine 3-dehydrogenase